MERFVVVKGKVKRKRNENVTKQKRCTRKDECSQISVFVMVAPLESDIILPKMTCLILCRTGIHRFDLCDKTYEDWWRCGQNDRLFERASEITASFKKYIPEKKLKLAPLQSGGIAGMDFPLSPHVSSFQEFYVIMHHVQATSSSLKQKIGTSMNEPLED